MRVVDSFFCPIYCADNGNPNAPALIALMVLKEVEGLSNQKHFENCRFNLLVSSAIGLQNPDNPLPTESTYYLFRKSIANYAKGKNENIVEIVFARITKDQQRKLKLKEKTFAWKANCWAAILPGLAVTTTLQHYRE